MNWVVYMLECKDNSIYTGIAKNLENRLITSFCICEYINGYGSFKELLSVIFRLKKIVSLCALYSKKLKIYAT